MVDGAENDYTEEKSFLTRTMKIPFEDGSSELEIIAPNTIEYSSFLGCLEDSPKQQIMAGKPPQDVVCNHSFVLIRKISNDSVACVTPPTLEKLVERGWAKYEFPIIFETDKHAYKFGESITITMKNIGPNTLKTSSIPIGFSIYDENDNRICAWNGVNLQNGYFAPEETLTVTIDDKNGCRDLINEGLYKIESGLYRIKADHFYEFGLWLNYHGPVHKIRITS